MLLGLIAGTTTAVAGFAWLMPMLLRFSGFPAPICAAILLVLGIWQGGRMAFSAWLFARAERNGWGIPLAWPLALVAGEALYPLLFPWYFGCSLVPASLLAQCSDLGGPMLLSAVLALANATIALWMVKRFPRPWAPTFACCAALVASLTYGWWRSHRVDALVASAPVTTVGLVQGAIAMDIQGQAAYRDAFQRQASASRDLVAKGASWLVWSESAFLYPVPEDDADRFLYDGLTRSLGRPAILGALVYRDGARGEQTYNSALVTNGEGRLQGRYDKHYLLAFGEYLPLGETFPILHKWSPASGRISAGSGFQQLSIDGHPIAILICYEDILPGFVLDAVRATSPSMLVDITNDAWFGETSEPELHLALSRLRAIEHRTFLVRAAKHRGDVGGRSGWTCSCNGADVRAGVADGRCAMVQASDRVRECRQPSLVLRSGSCDRHRMAAPRQSPSQEDSRLLCRNAAVPGTHQPPAEYAAHLVRPYLCASISPLWFLDSGRAS